MKLQCVSHLCALSTCERGQGLTVCPPVSSHVPSLAWPPHACQCHGVWATLPGSRVQQASKTNTTFKHYSRKDPVSGLTLPWAIRRYTRLRCTVMPASYVSARLRGPSRAASQFFLPNRELSVPMIGCRTTV